MRYFKPSEFACQCGKCGLGYEQMQAEALALLDDARHRAGVPFRINSAFRCATHNRNVGGENKSSHTLGYAVDVATSSSHIRQRVLYGLIAAGFNRIGIYASFIHADCDPSKPPEVCWLG